MKFSYPPNFAFDNEPAIWQNPFEFYQTVNYLNAIGAKTMLEIGTGYGLMAQYLREFSGIKVWSIDISPKGVIESKDFRFLCTKDSKFSDAYIWAKEQRYSVVYIDGAHDWDTTLSDYHWYSKLANKAIILHDIDGNQLGKYPVSLGPHELWNEQIKPHCSTIEIRDKEPYNCGVGIILL